MEVVGSRVSEIVYIVSGGAPFCPTRGPALAAVVPVDAN